jgi:hypothetical protein
MFGAGSTMSDLTNLTNTAFVIIYAEGEQE